MTDTNSLATTSTATNSLKKPVSDTSSTSTAAAPAPASSTQKPKSSWREKLHVGSKKSEEVGKESWRNANLSEEQRWKEWNKAKDKEQKNAGATGVFTHPYKAKGAGKWGYWLDALW